MDDYCERCGRAPARVITSRKHLGMIFFGKTWEKQGVWCKEHARAQVAVDLVFTLVLGWWGVISFFVTLVLLPGLVAELSKIAGMAAPRALPGTSPEAGA